LSSSHHRGTLEVPGRWGRRWTAPATPSQVPPTASVGNSSRSTPRHRRTSRPGVPSPGC